MERCKGWATRPRNMTRKSERYLLPFVLYESPLMSKTLLGLFIALGASNAWAAGRSPNRIDAGQAKALVMASLTAKQRRLPSLAVDPYDETNSKFMFVTVTWAGTPDGSVVVGKYGVDPYTGDVFSATMACHEEKNKHLEILQRRVRSRLRLTQTEYLKLKTKGPLCEQ